MITAFHPKVYLWHATVMVAFKTHAPRHRD